MEKGETPVTMLFCTYQDCVSLQHAWRASWEVLQYYQLDLIRQDGCPRSLTLQELLSNLMNPQAPTLKRNCKSTFPQLGSANLEVLAIFKHQWYTAHRLCNALQLQWA